MDFIKFICTAVLVLAPLWMAGRMLHLLDNAAKERKSPMRLWLVDFFSLLFLIQLPLAMFMPYLNIPTAGRAGVAVFFSLTVLTVWWCTIKTVSGAGIVSGFWRSVISLFVIPMAYIGSLVLTVTGGNIFFLKKTDDWYSTAWVLEVLLMVALICSVILTRLAIREAKLSTLRNGESTEHMT